MKILKYTTILFIIAFSNCVKGQIENTLTRAKYINMKINGISLAQIDSTKGNISQVKALFSDNMTIKTGTQPSLSIDFLDDNKGFYFIFEDGSDVGDNYDLVYFIISNKNSNFTILGKTVTIGSDISELGDVKIDSRESDISFGDNYSSSVLIIKFDPSTRKITEIEYTVFN